MTSKHYQDCLTGLEVKVSNSRAADLGLSSACAMDLILGRFTSDIKIGTPAVTLLGVWLYKSTGPALGPVGPASVCCDWEKQKVWSAASISMWQHVHLSEQICSWDTLACCWDVIQPSNNNTVTLSLDCTDSNNVVIPCWYWLSSSKK